MAVTESTRPPHDESLGANCECFTCVLRGVQIGRIHDPDRIVKARPGMFRRPNNAYEAGIPTSKRPGGFEMPYLRSDGEQMGQVEFDSKRHVIEENRKRLAQASPSPN